jgi:hypothetical protein
MRSESGNAAAVILDSNYADHGDSSSVIAVGAFGIVLADFTVQRSIFQRAGSPSTPFTCGTVRRATAT